MALLSSFDVVIALAECGSMRFAAERLNMSEARANAALQRLESYLEVPLFDKSSREMRLTGYGEVALVRARQIAVLIRNAREEVDRLRGQCSG